jgi:hypothetical protein
MYFRVLALALVLLVTPLAAQAQPSGRVYRLGDLSYESAPSDYTDAFRQGLRDLGWLEGRNIVIEYRWLGRSESDCSTLRPNWSSSTWTASLTGLVASLARPGGNVAPNSPGAAARRLARRRLSEVRCS